MSVRHSPSSALFELTSPAAVVTEWRQPRGEFGDLFGSTTVGIVGARIVLAISVAFFWLDCRDAGDFDISITLCLLPEPRNSSMLFDDDNLKLKIRVWVERGGKKLLGPGRVELLGHIDRLGSISAAARKMNMSYRRAWELVRDMNDVASKPLVHVSTGGSGGGGATLTAVGKEAIAAYRRIAKRLAAAAIDRRARK